MFASPTLAGVGTISVGITSCIDVTIPIGIEFGVPIGIPICIPINPARRLPVEAARQRQRKPEQARDPQTMSNPVCHHSHPQKVPPTLTPAKPSPKIGPTEARPPDDSTGSEPSRAANRTIDVTSDANPTTMSAHPAPSSPWP